MINFSYIWKKMGQQRRLHVINMIKNPSFMETSCPALITLVTTIATLVFTIETITMIVTMDIIIETIPMTITMRCVLVQVEVGWNSIKRVLRKRTIQSNCSHCHNCLLITTLHQEVQRQPSQYPQRPKDLPYKR